MRKLLLLTILLLGSYFAEAQQGGYEEKLLYCTAYKILETGSEIIEDEGKLSFRRAFRKPSSKKAQIYSWLKEEVLFEVRKKDYIEDNDSLLIYKQEFYGKLINGTENKDAFITSKIKIIIHNCYYIIEISDINFAEVKNRKGKSRIFNEQKFETILQKEEPNLEIVYYLDEVIAHEISRFWRKAYH